MRLTALGDWIRHGIGQLSAVAKQAGHTTSLIDLRRLTTESGIDWFAFEREVMQKPASVYAVSVLSANFDFAKECVARIRAQRPNARIIAGGIHVTVDTEGSKKLGADTLIVGEGENALPDVLEGGPPIVKGTPADLSSLPYADRELFSPYREIPIGYLPEPFHTIIIGRGCPHRCTFCAPAEEKLFGKKVRLRSVPHVIGELRELEARYGLASFLIHDDCFSAFPSYAEEFAEAKQARFPKASFYCQARADHIVKRPELFAKLASSGLRGCLVGIESGSQRVLDFLHKDTTVEDNRNAIRILEGLGVTAWANMMVGIPTETKSEVIETVRLAQEIKKIQPSAILSWAMYTPHPGSELFDYCEAEGINLVKRAVDYRRYFDPKTPKVKGVDYDFCAWAVSQA